MERMPLIKSIEEGRQSSLSDAEMKELIERVTGMALLYGVQKKITVNEFPEKVEPMPFTLFPSPMPRQVFDDARRTHTYFQTVIYKIANNHEFLYDCFKSILPGDDFTRALWEIYDTVRQEGLSQVSFMITRNDFMMEANPDKSDELCIKQVEFNTFASGAGGVVGALTDVHRYCLSITETPFKPEQLPDNRPTVGLAQGLYKAWELYDKPRSVILFIVGIPEPNTPDQRWLEKHLHDINPQVLVKYRTFEQLHEEATLTDNRELFVGNKEVAVVYFRYGYSPKHYTPKEFDLRLSIERSKAIKCPSVALHLAGCKKVQQVLSRPGVLEQFLDDASVISDLKKTFVGQVILDQDKSIVEKAKQNPERYVLKPQREGGGNNLFSKELSAEIDNIYNSADASSWIVMDRIQAHCHRNRLIRVGLDSSIRNVVSELGIYGVHIGTQAEELVNFECGYIVRTKPEESNEGGLFNGHSCLDTPFLIG